MKNIIFIGFILLSFNTYCQSELNDFLSVKTKKIDSLILEHGKVILEAQKTYQNAISDADKLAVKQIDKLDKEHENLLQKSLESKVQINDEIGKFTQMKQNEVDKINLSYNKTILDAQKIYENTLINADKALSKELKRLENEQEVLLKTKLKGSK